MDNSKFFQQAIYFHQRGQWDEAIKLYQLSLNSQPDHIPSLNNLGLLYQQKQDYKQAEYFFKQVIKRNATFIEAWFNLGTVYQQGGLTEEAQQLYLKVLDLDLSHFRALYQLGTLFESFGDYERACSYYKKVLDIQREFTPALLKLALIYQNSGQVEEALLYFQQVFEQNPTHLAYLSSYIGSLRLQDHYPHQQLLNLASKIDAWEGGVSEHKNLKLPLRPLKIGYLSPDFCNHSASVVFGLLYENHRSDQFEIYSYSQNTKVDSTTDKFQQLSDYWFEIHQLEAFQVARLIQEHNIDILVDLAGHTVNHRLDVFALKPAPIQISGLGFGCTTGLSAMDYRISDPYITPPQLVRYNREKVVYISSLLRWKPPELKFNIGSLPVLKNGTITFGCGNSLFKLNRRVLKVWAQILNHLPESQLHLKATELDSPEHQTRLLKIFENECVDSRRIRFSGRTSIAGHLLFYQSIDIALDPFPYNGGVTSCEALWMGIPIVTLAEGTRSGLSILSILDIKELIAQDEQDYIQKTVALASNREKLNSLRKTLRDRLEQSVICNGLSFAQEVENVYRMLWRQWCRK